ncbi:MAG: DUF4345 domain-containing protein [Deltaproteobacteria bacterium]|nr:DUF4345 domain-containing protein [Deltaproteobacteria bacterium]
MRFARGVLMLGALVFAGIGIGCVLFPAELMSAVDLALPSAVARTEIRAFYGGLELGVAVFLTICAVRSDWVPLGLTALACLMSGMGGVRLIAALAAGREAWTQIPIALVELSGAALGVWSLRRVRDARSPLWF